MIGDVGWVKAKPQTQQTYPMGCWVCASLDPTYLCAHLRAIDLSATS
jgi:hypothetical protein